MLLMPLFFAWERDTRPVSSEAAFTTPTGIRHPGHHLPDFISSTTLLREVSVRSTELNGPGLSTDFLASGHGVDMVTPYVSSPTLAASMTFFLSHSFISTMTLDDKVNTFDC